jgi:5'-3' exonuclease
MCGTCSWRKGAEFSLNNRLDDSRDGIQVYAAGSEDMDTLTFNAPILYRHLTFSEAKKEPISEINLKVALEGLQMEMSQFIDLCILLGCDYLEPIKGIGPKSALKLVREHGGLKGVVEHLREKYVCCFFASHLRLTARIGKQKKRKPQQIRRTGRREREAFTSPMSGRGKKPRKYLQNQT